MAGPGAEEAGHAEAQEGAGQAQEDRSPRQRPSGGSAGGLQRDDGGQGGQMKRRAAGMWVLISQARAPVRVIGAFSLVRTPGG